MDHSDGFEIRCQACGAREHLTFSEMEMRDHVQCRVYGTVRNMRKEDILETCRDAVRLTGGGYEDFMGENSRPQGNPKLT